MTALGGWGGEHLLSPHPRHFRTILGRAFPTLGYAFNRTMYNQITQVTNLILNPKADGDWTTAVTSALSKYKKEKKRMKDNQERLQYNTIEEKNKVGKTTTTTRRREILSTFLKMKSLSLKKMTKMNQAIQKSRRDRVILKDEKSRERDLYHFYYVQPTLSRVHHIGASSQVGNQHQNYLRKCTPWSGTIFHRDLLHDVFLGLHIGSLSNLQGMPCTVNLENTVYGKLKQMLFESGLKLPEAWYPQEEEEEPDDKTNIEKRKTSSTTEIQMKSKGEGEGKRLRRLKRWPNRKSNYSEFAHLIFDSMFDAKMLPFPQSPHPTAASNDPRTSSTSNTLRDPSRWMDVSVDSCRLLSPNYPICNSEVGRSNRWGSTFYPHALRWDIRTVADVMDTVLRKQLMHLGKCHRITPKMRKLWPTGLPQPTQWSTFATVALVLGIAIGIPLFVIAGVFCLEFTCMLNDKEKMRRRYRRKERKKKNQRTVL